MNSRRRFEWRYKGRRTSLGERTLVIGLIQLAPEYHAGSRDPLDADRAFVLATEMEEAGADLLFVSSEVLLSGVKRVTEAEEMRRAVPVLKRLRERVGVPVGFVTDRSAMAVRAMELGVEVILDPSGVTTDPELARVAARHDAGFVVSNMRGMPEMWPKLAQLKDPAGAIAAELDAALGRARRSGLNSASLVIDPGLGLGKRKEQDTEILAGLSGLARLEVPICIGAGNLPQVPALCAGALNGAHFVQCTDVKGVRVAVDVADGVLAVLARQAEKAVADTEDSSASPAVRRPFGESPRRR